MADNRRQIEVTDPAAWRQLAHPTRRALVYALQHRDRARVADLADEVGAAPNAVSFHLRRLAAHGFVEPADSPSGDAREKWWRSTAVRGFSVDTQEMRTVPGGERAVREVGDSIEAEAHEFIAAWFAQPAEPRSGQKEMRLNFDLLLDLTDEEYDEFSGELRDLLFRWSERTRTQEPGDRRRVQLTGYAAAIDDLRAARDQT